MARSTSEFNSGSLSARHHVARIRSGAAVCTDVAAVVGALATNAGGVSGFGVW